MQARHELPDDAALPGLTAIRNAGLAAAAPDLDIDGPVELLLCGYTPGSRATLEARAPGLHAAVKLYAEDPTPEVDLYRALTAELGAASAERVPALLSWVPDLRLLVIGWLDGSPANVLIREGQGERAGELTARWLRRAATLPVRVGAPRGAERVLDRADGWVSALAGADGALGDVAAAVATVLEHAVPEERTPRLVHGTLYARHVLDMGRGPGVIDWQRFGQGPLELDAGMFLATISRRALRHEVSADEVSRAEAALLAGTRGLLDEHALAWHRAAAMLHLARRLLKREPPGEARALLAQAARYAAAAM